MPVQPIARKMFKGATSTGAEAVGRDYRLTFVHQATGHSVEFPAAIQSFTDIHTPEFSERTFAGRMDPIYQQSAIIRNIDFTFVVANGSIEEARHNRQSVNLLIQMLYPKIDPTSRVPHGSYINVKGLSFLNDTNDDRYVSCLIRGINYSLNIEQGFITPTPGEIYPILLEVSVSAQAIIPTIHSFEEAEELFNSENWQQPYPPSYPNYYKKI